ncbi:hypothetical protein J6590_042382, partial [Homalodisca vitripennis]
MHLSLKGFLRTPETHHEAHQSTTSAVPQTAENNLSGPPGEIHHPCPNYQKWHTALLLLRGNQRAGAQQSPPAHYTFYRVDPPDGCRLCEDASSGDYAPPFPPTLTRKTRAAMYCMWPHKKGEDHDSSVQDAILVFIESVSINWIIFGDQSIKGGRESMIVVVPKSEWKGFFH